MREETQLLSDKNVRILSFHMNKLSKGAAAVVQ